eukprot:3602313-Rhodomonas_salina.1
MQAPVETGRGETAMHPVQQQAGADNTVSYGAASTPELQRAGEGLLVFARAANQEQESERAGAAGGGAARQ